MPVQYAGIRQEHQAVRTRAGLFDVSHMGELEFRGPEAVAAADRLVTNHVGGLEVGQALYTVCCNEAGGILDDLIVYRLGEDRVLVVCNASNRDKIAAHFQSHVQGDCALRDLSDEWSLLALQGPRAIDVMGEVGAPELLELKPFHVAEASVDEVRVWAARTGYTGEDGFELFCENAGASRLWRTLIDAGSRFGLEPVGLGARDTLRLEARLMLYGNDIDESTNPFEAGLGWVVKLKGSDFVGRASLLALKKAGTRRRLVGFEMAGRGIARTGYSIVANGERVGVVTSGSPGLTVGKNIGLGYVPKALARVGTPLGIEIRGRVVEAVVVQTPFYKR